jgi:Heterokaryon incompatibility protein (HET)
MNATFSYSPLPQGHIRVLQIKRDSSPAICYELRDQLLDDHLRFRAVSYAWGSPALIHSINCNGKDLPVTASVFELLSSTIISSFCDELPLWVDAICINQGDNAEKSHQVRQMHLLYSMAEEVIIWLGPSSSDSDLAIDTIRLLSEKKALIRKGDHAVTSMFHCSDDTLQKTGLADVGADVRSAIGSLYCRRWFGRLWVYQEVLLARQVQVACGSSIIAWDDFAEATVALGRLQIHQFSITFPNDDLGIRGLEGIYDMKTGRDSRALTSQELKSAYLLDLGQRRAVTDRRDRVYGMLAVASPQMRSKITVDYSQQDLSAWLRLCIDCGKASLEEQMSLDLLYMLSGREKNPDLPSWCPDLDAMPQRRFFLHQDWKAGMMTVPEGEGHPAAWFEPGEDDLYAPGCRVDIVSEVLDSTFCWSDKMRDWWSPGIEDTAENLTWESDCLTLARQTVAQQDEVPMAYILTLCEGFISQFNTDPLIIREAYTRTISFWREVEKSIPHEEINQQARSTAYEFHDRLMQNCRGRKFFSTTGGRFGVGPPDTQPGDEIYILYGAGPLYLIRFLDTSTQILGNVYIHGLMDFAEIPEDTKGENEIVVIN